MEGIKVKKFGPTCGKHGSSVFYKAFKYKKNGKSKIISLGQFFFMKILDSIPICIGEVQLVWEDKPSGTDLASVRLYFLPECTPDGRQTSHGEDEILAYYEKIVLKLNDLAAMVVHDVSWSDGRRAFTCARDKEARVKEVRDGDSADLADAFRMNSFGLDNRDVEKEIEAADINEEMEDSSPDVVIMTYPRYCRYRCMLKRLENCEDKWLYKTLVCALGGFTSLKDNNRVYFCKDIFEHADLDDFELRCDHLAPNLKGRPRKRKGSKRDSNDSSDDSSCSSSFSAQQDSAANKVRTGSRATPLRNGFRIDKINVSKDEQAFLIELHKYMKSRNTPIGRIPSLGFKQIDLFQFFTLAEEIGGYEQISMKRMWKHLYDKLGGNPGFTSAATCTRRHYEKLLLPFERYRNGREFKPIQNKKKKLKLENHLLLSEKVKANKQNDGMDVKVKGEIKVKTEVKVKSDTKPLENGKAESVNKERAEIKDKALIIKQEIEEMKMRKDARKHGTSIMNKTNTKVTGSLEKKKSCEEIKKQRWTEKGRRPSGGQKTVRELLHQNGQESAETFDGAGSEKHTDHKHQHLREKEDGKKSEKLDKRESGIPNVPKVLHAPTSQNDTKFVSQQSILPNMNAQRPMFYPQLIPVGGAIRNMTPIGMPFMIGGPQFGFQPVPNQMQTMQTFGGPHGVKDEKPLNALK
ncbi:AT-rich interactive domain-containing protein 5B-like isoform X1 [Ruditapes philippinarum]|uniref:AT-rich interactive domain-containing protein 5B-like isoform X1 n=1 Tax=Ruditapes philippinarum TaxID=129788 RepID=UPI00295C0DB5|nr:AT-rich interactive domain-containing protein 5B-like isoform X1 [Ruditapes philippinarum]